MKGCTLWESCASRANAVARTATNVKRLASHRPTQGQLKVHNRTQTSTETALTENAQTRTSHDAMLLCYPAARGECIILVVQSYQSTTLPCNINNAELLQEEPQKPSRRQTRFHYFEDLPFQQQHHACNSWRHELSLYFVIVRPGGETQRLKASHWN